MHSATEDYVVGTLCTEGNADLPKSQLYIITNNIQCDINNFQSHLSQTTC